MLEPSTIHPTVYLSIHTNYQTILLLYLCIDTLSISISIYWHYFNINIFMILKFSKKQCIVYEIDWCNLIPFHLIPVSQFYFCVLIALKTVFNNKKISRDKIYDFHIFLFQFAIMKINVKNHTYFYVYVSLIKIDFNCRHTAW